MNKTIPKIKVMHIKTKTVHYALFALSKPEPACYTAIDTNKNYIFTNQPITCKICKQRFENKAQVVEGWWSNQITEALKVRKIYECPFKLFANKYGYDLKHDDLIFPNSAPEFLRRRLDHYGLPCRGWEVQHSIEIGGLPKGVSISNICLNTGNVFDKVLLVKFMQYRSNGFPVNWELIKKRKKKILRLFDILHVKDLSIRRPTSEELLASQYGRSSVIIKAKDGNWYGVIDGTFTIPGVSSMEWESLEPDYFGDDITIEEAVIKLNMENITDNVIIEDAVEVWCDNECGQ